MTKLTPRIAGVFYLLTIVAGIVGLVTSERMIVSGNAAATATNILAGESLYRLAWAGTLLSTAAYVVVTALFYELFKPVNRTLSLVAAFFSLVGCTIWAFSCLFDLAPLVILKSGSQLSAFSVGQLQTAALLSLKLSGRNSDIGLVFFGVYCILIGLLIFRSGFLPRILGVLMVIGGSGSLTYFWPPFASSLFPYILLPTFIAESSLTLWLLVMGVDVTRWNERASATSIAQ